LKSVWNIRTVFDGHIIWGVLHLNKQPCKWVSLALSVVGFFSFLCVIVLASWHVSWLLLQILSWLVARSYPYTDIKWVPLHDLWGGPHKRPNTWNRVMVSVDVFFFSWLGSDQRFIFWSIQRLSRWKRFAKLNRYSRLSNAFEITIFKKNLIFFYVFYCFNSLILKIILKK
jgi:hypothetical protein